MNGSRRCCDIFLKQSDEEQMLRLRYFLFTDINRCRATSRADLMADSIRFD